jgi:hypothetical protein
MILPENFFNLLIGRSQESRNFALGTRLHTLHFSCHFYIPTLHHRNENGKKMERSNKLGTAVKAR